MGLRNSIACIIFGLIIALISCSAVKMAKQNINVQSRDTSRVPLVDAPPHVPAFVQAPIIKINNSRRQDFKPFKDSLINGMLSIKAGIDNVSSKLDTGLKNQGMYMQKQIDLYGHVIELESQVKNLQLDTTKLYKKLNQSSRVSSNVQQDATIGKTVIVSIYRLLIIVGGFVVATFIVSLVIAWTLRKRPKNNIYEV